ncbi:hypothetical protein BD413DRAFT_82826 [Trametes elegans]|nr:hypothetical protein BD413DRAFT_82826 [Trametes elegans]
MPSIRGVHGLARGAGTPADDETEKSSVSSSKGQMRPYGGQAYPSPSVKSDSHELPELPPGSSFIELVQKRGELLSEEEKSKAWSDAASMVKTYSDELVDRWNKEIDTYLVYAGLFSAILTAFNVESYSLLQPPAPDQTMAALEHISLQLSSFAFNAPFVNLTQSPFVASPDATPPVPRSAVWLNALWFSALILSLASASLSIMVKQWLNQFQSGLSGTSRQIARLRQYRLDNVVKWRVADIVTVIPFLLQLALGLFLAGLLVLLWTLHDAVAAVATVLVSLVALSTVGGIVLPLFKRSCAYITPQTLVLYSVWKTVSHALYKPQHRSTESTMTWEGQERHAVHPALLDPAILASAYKYTLNSDALAVAAKCLTDCSPVEVGNYLRMLHGAIVTHFGHTVELARAWTPVKPSHTQLLLWAQAMLFTLWSEHPRPAGWDLLTQATLANVLGYWLSQPERGLSSSPDDTPAEWLLAMLSTLVEYLQEEGEGREEIQSVIECLYDARSRLLGWAKEVDVDSSAAMPLGEYPVCSTGDGILVDERI